MRALWDLPEQQQSEVCQAVCRDVATQAQEKINAAIPSELLVPFTYVTQNQQEGYGALVREGSKERTKRAPSHGRLIRCPPRARARIIIKRKKKGRA